MIGTVAEDRTLGKVAVMAGPTTSEATTIDSGDAEHCCSSAPEARCCHAWVYPVAIHYHAASGLAGSPDPDGRSTSGIEILTARDLSVQEPRLPLDRADGVPV